MVMVASVARVSCPRVQASATPPRAKRTHAKSRPDKASEKPQRAAAMGAAIGRREAISMGTAFGTMLLSGNSPVVAVDTKEVGQFLPPYGKGDLVLFVPGSRETPAIRAGTIDPNKPYSFALPPNWKRDPVANIASGNYCQPRCAEPWTEVIFSSPADGRAQVIICPLERLISKTDASLEEIGPPEGLIGSFGPYITGTNVEEEEVLSASTKKIDGRTYYDYEVFAPYGTQPPHGLASLTTKGDAAILFVVNATEKQWANSKDKLKAVVDSFVV